MLAPHYSIFYRLPFWMLSGVGRGMGVLDGDPRAPRRRGSFGVYSTHAWKVNNISVRTIYRLNWRFIGFLKIQSSLRSMLGF